MHYLILDTCVWVDLAVSEFSLVAKLARLIDAGKVRIVLPEIIRTEWNGCKKKIETQLSNEIVEARRSALRLFMFMEEIESTEIPLQFASCDPLQLSRKVVNQRIDAIDAILNSHATELISISAQTKAIAIKHAMEKKAPFRMRNSMADALIFLSAVEWANKQKPDFAFFVTHNTKDFSEKSGDDGDTVKERLASDLQELVENEGMKFGTVIGRVLNEVEQAVVSDTEVEIGEAVVARKRFKDDLIERLMSNGDFSKILDRQGNLDQVMPNAFVSQMLEQQKKFNDLIEGGAASRAFAQHKKINDLLERGAYSRALEQQKHIDDLIERGLEQNKKIDDLLERGAYARALEQQKKINDLIEGGAASRAFEQQQKKIDDIVNRLQ